MHAVIILSLLSFYIVILLFLFIGLISLKRPKNTATDEVFVSVVIAARNEETNLRALVDCFQRQTWRNFEVIVVDDRSTDGTPALLQQLGQSYNKLKILTVPADAALEMTPKKNALNAGIAEAAGEILLFTDADCFPEPGWIAGMVKCFTAEVGLVAGYVATHGKGLSSWFTEVDKLGLACVAAGTIGLGFPITCSGGNLAYRKEVFHQVGGFSRISHLAAGDDVFFLQLVNEMTDWKIAYCRESYVLTDPPHSPSAFWSQSIRRASKGKGYGPKSKILLSLVYLLNLWLFLSPLLYLLDFASLNLIATVLIGKMAAEFLVILWGVVNWRRFFLLLVFPLIFVLHIGFVAVIGLLGQFVKFEWKE